MALLDELIVAIGMDTQDLTSDAQGAANEVESSLGGIQAAAAGAAVGGLFAAGLTNAMDASAANTKLANQLDLNAQEAARAGDVAGDVFSAGFGASIDEVSGALGAVSTNMADFADTSDADLQQLTRSALGLAETFEFDVAESSAAAGTLIKAGLAKDGTEAFDLITAAAQKLPPALREELPTLTKEYGEFFDQLGFTGPDMMGLLVQASKDPLFELDKLGDALKEFTLLLTETEKVRQPLKDLGLDVEDIQKLVNEGKGTEAFDQVTTALKGVEDQTERTALQAALFGGPGEDMGNSLLNLDASGAAAATGLDNAAGAAKDVTDSMAASQSLDAIWRTLATTIGEMLAPVLQFVSDFMAKHPGLVQALVPVLIGLGVAFGIAAAAVWVMNSAMLANPIFWIIAAVLALVAVIVVIATKTTWFQDLWGAVWGWITDKASSVSNWFNNTLLPGITGVFSAIGSAAGGMWRSVRDFWNNLVDFVTGIPARISSATSGMWDGITRSFKGAINGVIGWWNNLSFTIGGGSIMGVDIPSITLGTPNIPYLADGGVVTSATLAMVGEGREAEAVLPLSRLDGMLRGVATAVRGTGDPRGRDRLVIDVTGADEEMKRLIARIVRVDGAESIGLSASGE
ncbi:phage tail tape measure protein [Streptomyces phaeochromogenes]